MDASKIGGVSSLPDYQQMKAYSQAPSKQGTAPATSESADANKDRVNTTSSVTLKNFDTVKAIESLHTRMNQFIKGVRETTESLNLVAGNIDSMKKALSTILKNFPPFPMDSKERQEMLMSVSTLKNEIMKMTVPAPPSPAFDSVRGQWGVFITPAGQMQSASLPDLGVASTDREVAAAYTAIATTGDGIAKLSSDITQALVQ